MNKLHLRNLFILSLTLLTINLFSQDRQIIVSKNYVAKNSVTLISEKQNSATLKFDVNELNLIEIDTEYGKMYKMESDKAPLMLEAGSPELFYLPATIIIPDKGSTKLEIVYGEYKEISNVEIAPSRGGLSRSIDPTTVPYKKGDVYEVNDFFPGMSAQLNDPFIMRDVRGQTIFAYPVQYNPVTKMLRIYSEITVTANYTNESGINEFVNQKRHKTIEPEFKSMYNNLFLNQSVVQGKDYPTDEEGELLIICHPAFMDAMKPYINWKRTIGRKTTMVSTDETGTTAAAIKTYISDYYANPDNNLAFVLFVGDNAQIPAHTAPNAPSDVFYAQLTGNDPYVEILIGRMSAETVAHVETQVQRAIHYERDLTDEDTWIAAAIGIATFESGGHDGGESDHTHMNNIRNRMLNYGYDPVYQEYGSGSGVPVTTAAMISQRFNDGVSIANYCNHGLESAWTLKGGPTYSTTHVAALTNAGKLPFIFSVACLNGKFMHSAPCFAEAWLRSTQNNQPTGAVATYMATISLSWAPPMTAQDEFVNICMEIPSTYGSQQPGKKRTIAGAMLNASQKMLLVHGANPGYLTARADYDSWCVFGDPTLMFRTKTPQEMIISHIPVIFLGTGEFEVECNIEGAFVTASYTDENEEIIILDSEIVENGVAKLIFEQNISFPYPITLAVVARDMITYLTEIEVTPANEPFVILDSFSTETPDFGQTIGVTLSFKNISENPYTAYNVNVSVNSNSPYITIEDANFEIGDLNPESIFTLENKLFVTISENVPDQERIFLNITMTGEYEDETYTWNKNINFRANASIIEYSDITVTDLENNPLEAIEPGASAYFKIKLQNNGHAASNLIKVKTVSSSDLLTFEENIFEIVSINADDYTDVIFTMLTDENTPEGTPAEIIVRIFFGNSVLNFTKTVLIGAPNSYNMANDEITTTYCDFYDNGGPKANYGNNQNTTMTFYPATEGNKISYSFKLFDVETYTGTGTPYDYLEIFNGINTSATSIGKYIGTTLPPDFKATNDEGAITFTFKSDASVNRPGWKAIVYESVNFYTLSFEIFDEDGDEISDATIVFDDLNFSSNYTIQYILSGDYHYTVSRHGYIPQSGTIKIEKDEILPVILEIDDTENFNLTFNISICETPFEGAVIKINNKTQITNENGQAVFLLPSGSYEYMIIIDESGSTSGVATVKDSDTEILFSYTLPSSVTFIVTYNDDPVAGAVVIFNRETLETDIEGKIIVSGLSSKIYDFIVSKEDYQTETGSITVKACENQEVEIKLKHTSIENIHFSDFYVYPNPFKDLINIGGNSSLVKKVYINNMLGQRIKEIVLEGKSSFATENLPKGVYTVTFERFDKKYETVKMIKQ